MPYGAQVQKLDTVYSLDDVEIAVYKEVLKMLDLRPGQKVDDDTLKKIMAENERRFLAKE